MYPMDMHGKQKTDMQDSSAKGVSLCAFHKSFEVNNVSICRRLARFKKRIGKNEKNIEQ